MPEKGVQTMTGGVFEIPEIRKPIKKKKDDIFQIKTEPIKNARKRICNDSSEDDDMLLPK